MKKFFSILIFLAFGLTVTAQVITPFAVRKTLTQKGGILYLANTSSKATPANVVQNEMPPSGNGYDNNFTNAYVDVDADATTWMSSSDSLTLPTCSEISWVGLYWGGPVVSTNTNFATRNQVKLKCNNGSYALLTADYLKDNTVGYKTYHCFKDITSIVAANGLNGRYTVANMVNDIGGKNLFGGWTIVVMYKNNTQTMRNLTVFDGLANVSSGATTVDIPISGFQTPLSGPVTFDLGLVVYDGDRSLIGDSLLFKGATTFKPVSDALHNANDVFNSTIARSGVLTPYRNPSYNNTLGYDANIFSPDNSAKAFIGNNAVSAIIRQKTGGETYLTQVVTSAIDVYEPDLRAGVRVTNITNPGASTAQPGDVLEYTVTGLNVGSDPSIKTYILDTLEGTMTYIPGTASIVSGPNAGPMTDAAGDDQIDYIASSHTLKVRIGTGANSFLGGTVNNSPLGTDSTVFRYRATVSNDCVLLTCDNTVNNAAYIYGTGNVSGNNYSNESTPGVFDGNGCLITGTTNSPINVAGCGTTAVTSNSPLCPGGTINLSATYSSNATYSWTGPNGFTSTSSTPSISNATSANAGTYICTIYVAATNCHYTLPVTVVINSANAGPDQTGAATCGLTAVTLAGNNPSGSNGVWSIFSGTGGTFGSGSATTSTVYNETFHGVAGSTYVLVWSLTTSGCGGTSTDSVTIKFNTRPSAAVLTGNNCPDYLSVAITGGTSPYTLVITGGVGTINSYVSGTNITVSPVSATTYTLTAVTAANGCTASSISGTPTVNPIPVIAAGSITELNSPGGGADSAGAKFATKSFVNTAFGSNAVAWSNKDSVFATNSNSSLASTSAACGAYVDVNVATTKTTTALELSKFGFSIPVGSTINGFEVKVRDAVETAAAIRDSAIVLMTGTTPTLSSNKALKTTSAFSGTANTLAIITYPASGASTDTWGRTWTAAEVNDTSFGIRLMYTNTTTTARRIWVDYATIKVWYSNGSGSYCDSSSKVRFQATGFTNATSYAWTAPTGAVVDSGQGTSKARINFQNAGQSGTYTVSVVPSAACTTGATSNLSISVSDCTGGAIDINGNVYWDINGSAGSNKVDGTALSTVGGRQLYVTAVTAADTVHAAFASVAVNSDGTYKIAGVTASTNYIVVLDTVNRAAAAAVPTSMTLPNGNSYNGEINNNLTNTTTGNDGLNNGKVAVAGFSGNSETNVNFGIKINTPPVAVADATSTNEDTPVTITVVTNDTDIDGTVAAASVDLDPSTSGRQTTFTVAGQGTYTVDASGIVTFTPVANFNGTSSLSYVVKDNDSNLSNSALLTITINAVNDVPVATASSVTFPESTTYTFTASNFSYTDVESDAMVSVTIATLPSLGTLYLSGVAVTANQVITTANIANLTYVPVGANYGSPYTTFTFKVNDAGSGTVAGTMTVNVTHTNLPPVAVNDTVTTNQNTPVSFNVLSNDTNVDGTISTNTVDLDLTASGIQNTLTIGGEGTYTVSASGVVTFTPTSTFYGTATPITYTVNNSLGLTSNQGTIAMTVTPAGAPIAVKDSVSTLRNVTVVFNPLSNDTAVGAHINPGRVDLDPATPGLQQSYYIPGEGQFYTDLTGYITFVPDWNFYGMVTSSYTVKDSNNFVSNVAVLKVNVLWTNTAPFAVDDIASTNEDTPVTFNVTSNDYDLDFGTGHGNAGILDSATVDLDPSTAGIQNTRTVTGQGTFTVNSLGFVTFTPFLNYNGPVDPIYYTINDKSGATSDSTSISITVNSVNDAPVAVANTASTAFNTAVTINVTTNDTDVDGSIDVATVDLNTSTAGIQNTFTVAGQGTYTVSVLGVVTFTPTAGFSGAATPINYTVNDNLGLVSNSTTISVTVAASGIPVAYNDAASTNEDSPVSFNVLTNDVDNTPDLDSTKVDLDPSIVGVQNTYTVAGQGTFTVNTHGVVTFTPVANYYGTSSISYMDSDLTHHASNIATMTVTINPVNDAPSFTKGADASGCQNGKFEILGNWATSISAGPSNESSQTVTFSVTNNNNSLFTDQPAVDEFGTLSYSPAPNQYGTATVSVRIKDNGGLANGGLDSSAAQTFTITINQKPAVTAIASSYAIYFGNTVTLTAGGASTYSWSPSGTLSAATGSPVTATPANSITYLVTGTDANGCTATSSVDITATHAPDHAPVAVDDTGSTNEDTQTTVNVVTNDTDADGNLDPSTVDIDLSQVGIQNTFSNAAGSWSVDPSGLVTYIPTPNFNGTAEIYYTVQDFTTLESNTASITIDVAPVNDVPVAVDDTPSTDEDTPLSGNVSTNDTPSGDGGNSWSLTSGPSHGSLTLNSANGTYTYTPSSNYNGTDAFTYSLCDGDVIPDCSTATVSITVNPVNDVPVAVDDTPSTDEDTPLAGNVSTNDTPSGDGGNTWSLVGVNGGASNGTVTMNSDGTYTYTPAANFNGTDAFTYTLCDNTPDCSTATVSITVNPVNDAPTANDDHTSTNVNASVSLNITTNDVDIDGSIYDPSVDLNTSSAGIQTTITTAQGTWTSDNAGHVLFVPALNFAGTAILPYTVNDNDGATSNTAYIRIDVAADVCETYTWAENGVTYTQSGIYTHTYLYGATVETSTLFLTVRYHTTFDTTVSVLGCFTWHVNNATYTVTGNHSVTFTNAAGCDSIVTLHLTITPGVYLNAKVILSGPYVAAAGLMHDSLRVNGLIPSTEPYTASPYNKMAAGGPSGETVSNAVLSVSGNDAIVDWVFLELRDALNPGTVVANKRALIQRDGDIVSSTDGVSPVYFPTVYNGNYYVTVKHRNHLGVMSLHPLSFSGCSTRSIDFTTSDSVYTAPCANLTQRKQIGSVYTLWAGDANNNKNVKYNGLSNDKDMLIYVLGISTPNNTVYNVYRMEDVNMDGKIRYNNTDNDRSVILNNVGVGSPNNVIYQHTPN